MMYDFFQYDFLRYALYTALLIGWLAPLLGVFIVVRRMSFIADALSHVALAGIAFGMYVEKKFSIPVQPLQAGMAFSVLGSLWIERLRGVYKQYQELAIPILMSLGIGLGVLFISLADGFSTDIFSYLFGSVSAVSRQDFISVLVVAVVVAFFIVLFYKEWFAVSFDEEHAKASGLPVKALHVLFILLVAFVIAASMRIVGVLLVSSMMTLPVAAAMRIAKSFRQTIIWSILFGEFAIITGLLLAYDLNIAPGGTIVLVSVFLLIVAQGWRRTQLRTKPLSV
ncbi:metal ABC transporter permease [Bacillus fonticola]|uniref:metal ABC transporter permease n=1 Tax=Bacillus fonticola TaxID=2728853 RepID=UPI0014760735|nr:metal ABC transporter permease [Bacillus fonticola]